MSLSEIMSAAGLSSYAEIGLVLFVLAFIAIVWRVFRPSSKARFDAAARLPLDDDSVTTPRVPRER